MADVTPKKEPAWMPQLQKVSEKQMKTFLYALMRLGNVKKAAKAAGANRTALYQRKARDEDFAEVWESCLAIGVSELEDVTQDLAVNGWQEPVFHEGEECGKKQRYSPALQIFLLKSHNPEKYRERYDVQHAGQGGGSLSLEVVLNDKAVQEVTQ